MMRGIALAQAALVLSVLFSATAAGQAAPLGDANAQAVAAITACLGRLGDATNGLARLEVVCPDLVPALQAAHVAALIIPSSRDRLDRQSLIQLGQLLHPPLTASPAVSKLAPFLPAPQARPGSIRTWWQRLWDWLVAHLGGKQQSKSDSWLSEFARQLAGAQWLWKALITTILIVVAVGVPALVVLEVRAMGRRSLDDPKSTVTGAAIGATGSSLALLRRAPLAQRPAQLFAMLISRLVVAGRLPPDRSLTHREVVRKVMLDDVDQRRLIESLARVCEWQLYSGKAATPEGLETLLAQGEDLYTTGWGRPVER